MPLSLDKPVAQANAQDARELAGFNLWFREGKPDRLTSRDTAVAYWNGLPYGVKQSWRERADLTTSQRKTLDAFEHSVAEALSA